MTQQQGEYIVEKSEVDDALAMLGKGYETKKAVETMASGFTPCPDILTTKYSHTTSLIWGKIWRFCQMPEDVCRAAIKRIADELSLSTNTIAKHIEMLEKGGYILDKTPNLRNKPHTYIDTGKLHLKISLWMAESGTQNLSSHYSKTEVEESTTNSSEVQKNIFACYEKNIAMLTPVIADTLQEAEKEYPADWITDAIRLAVENNKRNWRYCEAILKRWKESGKDEGKGKPQESSKSEYETIGLTS